MNARDLPEKWEREYEQLGFPDAGAAETYLTCARELRAALPEQPLSRKWRERIEQYRKDADDSEEATAFALIQAGKIIGTQDCLADLDSHESESRELLREAPQAIVTIGGVSPRRSGKTHLAQLSDRIRKHLGGESDESRKD